MDVKNSDNETKKVVDIEVTDENTALTILVSFCNLAQQRGAYNLKEAAVLSTAIEVFTPAAEEVEEVSEEATEETTEEA